MAALNGTTSPATPSPSTMNNTPRIETIRPPSAPDPTALSWIIDQQKERITELKNELLEAKAELKKVGEEKESLNSSLKDVQSQLEAKPSALAGILQDREVMGPLLLQGAQLLNRFINPQASLEGVPTNPLTDWFARQPEQVQKEFVALIQNLNKAPDKMSENLASINRNLMSVSSGGSSFGFGRR